MAVVTFTATLVAGRIHLQQDSGGAAYSGSVLTTIFSPSSNAVIQTILSVTSGQNTTNWNFAPSLNSSANGTYYVSAIDRTSVNAGTVLATSHPTLTLTKTGSNAYSGAVYVAPFTWVSHTVSAVTPRPGASITSHLAIAGGVHTFRVQIISDFDNAILFDGSLTTDATGAGDISYSIPVYPNSTVFSVIALQPNTVDSGISSITTLEVTLMAIALGAATIQVQSTDFVDSYGEKKTSRVLLDNTATGAGIATAMGHLDAITNADMHRVVFSQEAILTGQKAAAVVALQDKVRELLVLTFVAPFPGAASGKKIKQVVVPAPTANSYVILPNGGSAVDTTNADVNAVIAFYATHLQYEVRDNVTGAITYNGGFVFDPTRSGLATAGDIIDGN